MRHLYLLMLMMLPLLSLSQNPQTDIERLNKDSFKISNDAAQAHHFLIIERDSLLDNNLLLRIAIDSLNSRNKKLVDRIFKIAERQADALSNQSEAIEDQNQATDDLAEANDFITEYWKDLSNNSHLSGSLISDVKEFSLYRFEVNLRIPITGKFNLIARPTFAPLEKPVYLIGINYSFF